MRRVGFMTSIRSLVSCSVLMTVLFVTAAPHPFAVGDARARAEEGWATFYAKRRAGRRTASGERYDPHALVAAHPTLAFGTEVRVTRVETGTSVVVKVIDRGPSRAQRRRGYIIDLSRAAAESLAFVRNGRTRVRLDVVGRAGSSSF